MNADWITDHDNRHYDHVDDDGSERTNGHVTQRAADEPHQKLQQQHKDHSGGRNRGRTDDRHQREEERRTKVADIKRKVR